MNIAVNKKVLGFAAWMSVSLGSQKADLPW